MSRAVMAGRAGGVNVLAAGVSWGLCDCHESRAGPELVADMQQADILFSHPAGG